MTTTTILFLDALCVVWVVAVMSNPFQYLTNVLAFLLRGIGLIAFIVPLVYGLVLACNGKDGVLGHVIAAYVMELVGILLLAGSILSLNGILTVARSVWTVYCCMIALPCWFILGSIVYLTW